MPMSAETRTALFTELSAALRRQSPPLVCVKETASACEFIGNIPVPYGSRKKIVPGMAFASVVVHRDMVSFHFMPIYYHRDEFAPAAPTLLRRLKGKACFNFTSEGQIDRKELQALLERGVRAWRKLGYVR